MQEEQSEGQPTERVLPGSRWRQRAYSGHAEQEVTVLRVGARSVMLVIEGAGLAGHDRRKVGQKFNVVLETFLKTHTLISQPKGYKPGDEIVAPPAPAGPKKDAVETLFKRRRFAEDWLATMEGQDIRAGVADPRSPVLPGPVYTGDVVINPPAPEPTPQEEPVQSAQAEPDQPFEDIVPEEVLAQTTQTAEEPAPEPAAPTVDPLDALVDNARAIVAGLEAEIAVKIWDRDELAEKVAKLDAEIATLTTRRTRATHAVDALVATLLGIPEPEPEPEPTPEPAPAPPTARVQTLKPGDLVVPDEVVVRPANNGTTRLAGREGYVPRPGKVSQRQWVLDRFVRDEGLVIQAVVNAFSDEYEITREAAIKNISSIMHHQIKHPNPQWPVPVRVHLGTYALPQFVTRGQI